MDQRGEQLEQAFRTFNALSGQLEESYRYLQERVAELSRRLAEARAERRAKARQAEQLATRLELLLATLPAGVVVLDDQGRIQKTNPAAETILGIAALGRRWSEVAAQTFEPTSAPNGDGVTRDGRRVSILSSSGSSAGRIVLLTDVTERRALETLVNRNDRLGAMGRMAASLAHQIRTPLASALLYFSQCRKAVLAPRYATALTRGIDRLHDMDRLVQDMLVFARGGGPGERVRIADLFKDVRASVGDTVPTTAQFVIHGDDTLVEIEGNRSTLVAAVTNLVDNAFEAAPRGAVNLRAAVRGNRVELAVHDDGPGIPQDIRQRIFEPFFSTRPTGTGLGLAVAKTVAEAHGGSLRVDSGPAGTTIALDLPLPAAGSIAVGEPVREVA